MTGRGVDDHPCGLVDDCEVFVLIHHVQCDRFGGGLVYVGLRNLEFDDVTRCHAIRGIGGPAVHQDEVALDEARGSRAAEVLRIFGEEAIEPERRGGRDQAAVGLRRRYPASRATTPMLMAESATLNTGQKWTLMKSVTVPNKILS